MIPPVDDYREDPSTTTEPDEGKSPPSKRYENRGCANPEDDLNQVSIDYADVEKFGTFVT